MAATTGRLSGILLPLFSVRSRTDFGVGDFGGVKGLFQWMSSARQRLLMLLPLLPTAPGDSSPYSCRSAFGINPLFIDLSQVPEFIEAGGEAALGEADRARLEEARRAPRIRYDLVFPLKFNALRAAFDRFEGSATEERKAAFDAFRKSEGNWLDGYALYAALSDENQQRPWWEWPEGLRDRHEDAVGEARGRLAREIAFHAWLQWIADVQWKRMRDQAREAHVLLCGDEPFIIGQDSADCWLNPKLLRRDARLGVPPDDFSATGQDWGLPYFDFAAMEQDGYGWLKARAENAASYYDLRRVDHAVGYFREWIRDEQTPTGRFVPDNEKAWRHYGETHFRLLSEGAGIVAEDLGVIPPFVREILARLGLPGYRVMRWERDGLRYRDPRQFPKVSLATTGTHDTEPVAEWWETASQDEREAMARAYPAFEHVAPTPKFTPEIHRATLAATLQSSSDLCVLPWQDVLGTRDRINLPGSMSDANWAYRMAQNTEELPGDAHACAAAAQLEQLTRESGR